MNPELIELYKLMEARDCLKDIINDMNTLIGQAYYTAFDLSMVRFDVKNTTKLEKLESLYTELQDQTHNLNHNLTIYKENMEIIEEGKKP